MNVRDVNLHGGNTDHGYRIAHRQACMRVTRRIDHDRGGGKTGAVQPSGARRGKTHRAKSRDGHSNGRHPIDDHGQTGTVGFARGEVTYHDSKAGILPQTAVVGQHTRQFWYTTKLQKT